MSAKDRKSLAKDLEKITHKYVSTGNLDDLTQSILMVTSKYRTTKKDRILEELAALTSCLNFSECLYYAEDAWNKFSEDDQQTYRSWACNTLYDSSGESEELRHFAKINVLITKYVECFDLPTIKYY